jgi:hypothetical protein
VQRPHVICMLWSDCQHNRSPPVGNVLCLKSNQSRDWYVVRLCSVPKTGLQRNVLSTHDLSAPGFDRRARTFVSRYSSR